MHEIGHSLGLMHSNVRGSVMWPLARTGKPVMHQDDINGINSLYGSVTVRTSMVVFTNLLSLLTPGFFRWSSTTSGGLRELEL